MKGKVIQRGEQLIHKYCKRPDLGTEEELLVIEPWGRDGLRVRATLSSAVLDTEWALTEKVVSKASISITDNKATITNGIISATLTDIRTQAGHLQFYKNGDPILTEYDYVVGAHNPGTRIYKKLSNPVFPNTLRHTEVHFAPDGSERIYGMGLNATGSLDLKGSVIDLYQCHVKHVVPFLVSSKGYGFLWNNPSLGRVEFGENRTRWVSDGCTQIDYYITAADSYADIMGNYAAATGYAPEFPYWASGFWQCKNRYKSQEEFVQIALEYKRRNLPLSVLVIDYQHWEKTGDWKLDPRFWPDPESMVDKLNKLGIRIMISPWVLVEEESENFRPMQDKEMFIKKLDGSPWERSWVRPDGKAISTNMYDPTNPDAAEFLWSKWKKNYLDLGIKTFWLDPCDDLSPITEYDERLYHIGPSLEAHGYYPVAHQKNVYEGLINAGEDEVVTICRSSWAGSQRYGASPAAHDIESSFKHLAEYMKAGLNLSMSGIPWGAAEIGGYVTPENINEEFYELVVRWYQYAVFTPVFRTHGSRPHNEAWSFGEDSYRHIAAAMHLRERLRPYIMTQMKKSSEDGIPPMRPLFFDFNHDKETHRIEDQFLFGSDLLIAPITSYKERERSVYLPDSVEWVNVWSAQKYAGGQRIKVQAPIEAIPVFLKKPSEHLDIVPFENLYDKTTVGN